MKKRIKISLTIICLCLSFLTLSYGVFAATNQTLTVDNYIQFNTSDIYINVNSLNVYQNNTYTTTKGTRVTGFTTPYELITTSDAESWSGGSVSYTSSNPYLVFEFSITNKSKSYGATLTIKDVVLPDNVALIKTDGTTATVDASKVSNVTFSIAKNTTQTVVFATKVKNLESGWTNKTLSFALAFSQA